LGKDFAEKKKFDANVQVVINEKIVGAETELTCAQMPLMQPVSLEKMDVEQVEVQSTGRIGGSDASMDEEEELQRALRLSLGETTSNDLQQSDLPIGYQAYEDFVGYLFTCIVELLSSFLKKDRCGVQIGPIIRLLLDLIRHSRHEDSKNERARRFAKEISHGMLYILLSSSGRKKLPQDKVLALVTCLRAFRNLLVPEGDPQYFLAGSQLDENTEEHRASKSKEKTNPKFVCDVHKIPAVRRRCAQGIHKDRRFYVCGQERGQRCKYFAWAEEVDTKTVERPKIWAQFQDVVRGYLWSQSSSSSMPLHARLCRLLEDEVFGDEGDECDVMLSLTTSSSDKRADHSPLKSYYGIEDTKRDFSDGVFCSREKLLDTVSGESEVKTELDGKRELSVPVRAAGDRGGLLLEAALDLLTLIATHQTEGISRWFSLLCEINISTNKPSSLRALAKKVLKLLCGTKRALYHSVRDHFAFGFQLKSLYRNAATVLEASLIVKEKARQCSADWAGSEMVSWSNLCVGGLIGTADLVSENDHSQICAKKLAKVLDELWSVIKNRGESWRRFCGLRSLPHSHRETTKSGNDSDHLEAERRLSSSAPIVALFWISCSLSGTNQVKMLRLIDFALTNWKDRKAGHGKSHDSSSDDEAAHDGNEEVELVSLSEEALTIPEDILITGEGKLTVDDVVAFAMACVYGGKTLELRKAGYHVAMKVCSRLSTADQGLVFEKLMMSRFGEVGPMGKTCVEFLNLLQSLARSLDTSVPVELAADLVMDCFIQQMNSVKYDRSNGEWVVLESGPGISTVKKKFDLAECTYCLKPHHLGAVKDVAHKSSERRETASGGRTVSRETSSSANQTGTNRSASITTSSRSQKKWHPEQVCPYVRGRLDSLKETSVSNEFCSFFTLKYRLVISDIHLTVNDPRGRFVKTISIYFTPRPVSDVSDLKSGEYPGYWQRCATINLPRGASRASASLPQPVVAANLKIEYSDFYERPGGSKASDGSMLVHCPRCTRGTCQLSCPFYFLLRLLTFVLLQS
jgi:hypothetical protein